MVTRSTRLDLAKTFPGRPNVKALLPRPGRNRLLCNDFHCMRQFASGMLCGRLGPHNPPALDRDPLAQTVEWAVDLSPATVQYVRVDHCGLYILVPQELLNGSDVVAVLQ